MQIVLNRLISRISLTYQFLLLSLVVLLICMGAIGSWLARQIEANVVNRAASISAVYMESVLAAQLHDLPIGGAMDMKTHVLLDRVFVEGPLRRKVVRFKLWSREGRIAYSSDHAQLGRQRAVDGPLAEAFAGAVQARMSELDEGDNVSEREHWSRLLEVYVPIRTGVDGEVRTVAEFYLATENLLSDIRYAQRSSWALVVLATVAIYLALHGLVRRANRTILDQQRDLGRKVGELRAALDDNERMRERLREAGARTTALNERFLQRVAADLHDGPAQDTALALLRFDELAQGWVAKDVERDFKTVRTALQSSLDDLRTIASELRMPDIEPLSLVDTARRAVWDFERKSGNKVETEIDENAPDAAPYAVRITVYRLIREALINAWWHAKGSPQWVRLQCDAGKVIVEVADRGPGFDPRQVIASGRLGLVFMRERVRLLGGALEIDSAPGRGTRIRAILPLTMEDTVDA